MESAELQYALLSLFFFLFFFQQSTLVRTSGPLMLCPVAWLTHAHPTDGVVEAHSEN